jgi:hypothetical protein
MIIKGQGLCMDTLPKRQFLHMGFFPVIKRRVGLGTLIFGPKTVNFGDPHFSQAFFLWKPIHRREGYRPEKEEMDLIDVVQH